MLAARGKYIYFLDSDDMLTEGTISHFKQVITEYSGCQMFLFGYEMRRNNATYKSYVFPQFDRLTFSGRILQYNFLSKKLCCHICSCIYDKAFILENELTLKPGLKIGEDVLFLMQLMFKVDKVYYSARLSFIYQIRDDSAMQGYKSYSNTQYEAYTEWKKFLNPIAEKDSSIRNYVNFFLLFTYISNLRYYLRSDVKSKELNKRFIADGNIRCKKNFVGNIFHWIAMKMMMLVPLRLTLKLLKHQ